MESLSVIIPVYNSKDHLENCVASVIAVNDHCGAMIVSEIILVDDGSSDGSSELCDIIAKTESTDRCKVLVVHQPNKGVSAARNAGLQAAAGTFVLFVDSDDTVEPVKLAELMRTVSEGDPVDMAVFGLSFDYYSGDRIYRRDIALPGIEGTVSFDECSNKLYPLFKDNAISPLWNKLIRRSIIEKTGIRLREDMFLYEDLEFSLRLMAECGKICFCREPIYRYRQAGDEGNAGRRLKRVAHIPEIVDKIEDALVPFGGSDDILLFLHMVLAREKISCASMEETDSVCRDFRSWIDSHRLSERIWDNEYGMLLYNLKSRRLRIKRIKTRIRHGIAVAIKKTMGDFRKR
ncbi:MAG: glycosyltransferase family 2 protein [Clostridia bacterium]|nr:glycosyltransferase family 2 protein [Clostridia bacterium]